MTRWWALLGGGVGVTLLLGAWTVRAAWPERHDEDRVADHFLPLHGDRLFALIGGPDGRYDVREDGAHCDVESVAVDGELRCDGYRFFVRREGARHRLVLAGLAVDLPAVIGTARDADYDFPVPGMGAHQMELLPVDRCPAGGVSPELPVVCVRNDGASGSLIVDRSARQSDTAPLAAVRLPLRHGESVLVDERDLLWAAHVPLRVRAQDGLVLLSVPEDDWTTLGGDRRWMAMDLPRWALAGDDATTAEKHVFWSREALFSTSPDPIAFRTHMEDSRVEYEQEEKLQSFIDNEMLCLSADGHRLDWNLATGKGCDGDPIPAPPAALWREAEQAAYQPGTRRILEITARALSVLPDRTPDPAGMVFVFDWAYDVGPDGELRRVPTRVLGVRPGSTRNAPPEAAPAIDGDSACALAKSGLARPPIDAKDGSTSAWLEVVEDGALARGTELLLPGSRRPVDGPIGALCAYSGGKAPAGVGKLDPNASGKLSPLREAVALGQLQVRTDAKAGAVAYWSASPDAKVPDGAKGACATLYRGAQGWTVLTQGDANAVRIGETLAEGAKVPLVDGARVRIGAEPEVLDLVFHAPSEPDHLAFDEVIQGRVERHYPFGALASPVVGFGALGGGLEGAGTGALWDAADKAWKRDTCSAKGEGAGVELTLKGDLQRIVAGEVLAMGAACQAGDPRCPQKGDDVTASAVLLDSATGDVLAVGNYPAFDPANAEQVEALRRELRLAGPGGAIQVPDLENKAFLRTKNAGSAYKLATSYALARMGRLQGVGKAAPEVACTRFTWYAPRAGTADAKNELLAPGFTPDGPRSQPCGHRSVVLADATYGYHDAFRYSVNLFFGLAPFAALPKSGIDYSAPKHVSTLADPLENPLGNASGLWMWDHGGRSDLGFVLAPGFDVATDLGGDNPFLSVLVGLGHRFHYPKVGGGVLYTQNVDGVGATTWPTAAQPWLPGLYPVAGFRYPSFVGPEDYAVEGVPGWSERDLVLALRKGGEVHNVAIKAGTSSIREYSRLAYGMGGVEASALSLAVMGSPMARSDGSVVSPGLVATPSQAASGRIATRELVPPDARAPIESAMRAVVNEGGSTAKGVFSDDVGKRIGGKTGTFEIARMTADERFTDPASWASIEAIVRYGCGVRGVTVGADDWKRLAASADKRAGRNRSRLDARPYVKKGLAEVVVSAPPPGFAASGQVCVDWGLRPGRPGVGGVIAGVDGGTWLDQTMALFPLDHEQAELVEGSSFIAVMFDGLIDPIKPGAPAPGAGWVLAVIVDGHPTGGKRTAARILDRIREDLLVEQSMGL